MTHFYGMPSPVSRLRHFVTGWLYILIACCFVGQAKAGSAESISSLQQRDNVAYALHSMGLGAESTNRFQVVEECVNGTQIEGVANYLQQTILFHHPIVGLQKASEVRFNFQLLDVQNSLARALHLDPSSGQLKVRGRVDRETLCPELTARKSAVHSQSTSLGFSSDYDLSYGSSITSDKPCVKRLSILSTAWFPGQKQPEIKTIPIEIHIQDINDNSPEWTDLPSRATLISDPTGPGRMSVIELQLPELSKDWANGHVTQPTRVSLPTAHDPDDGLNGRLNYRLESIQNENQMITGQPKSSSSSLAFVLEKQSNGQIDLVAATNLDYEKQSLHQFYLLASDMGNPSRTGTALVKVHLVDVNDEAPVFERAVFYPTVGAVSEKTIPGTVLLNLSATDSDASVTNNRLRYSMIPNPLAFKYFTVHPDGRVTLRHWLDYESMESTQASQSRSADGGSHADGGKQFVFQVLAIDSAPQPYEKTGTAMVIIPVIDENDEAPVITVRYLGPPDQTNQGEIGAVVENSGVPTRVAYIQVRDPDFEGKDQVVCHLSDSSNFSLTPIGSIHSSELGFPIDQQEEVKNDFILSLLTKTDRESTPLLFVRIKCMDQAGNANEQTIRIRVIDVNDESPKFSHPIYRFLLPENTDPGDVGSKTSTFTNRTINHQGYRIGRVSAQDTDHGSNARLLYRLEPSTLQIVPAKMIDQSIDPLTSQSRHTFIFHSQTDQKPDLSELFTIEPETGVIRALKAFDAENVELLRFTVTAVDQPEGDAVVPHTGSATVEVKIMDVNDWSPMFYRLNSSSDDRNDVLDPTGEHGLEFVTNYVFRVKENRPAFWLVGRVAAMDPDISQQWHESQGIGRSIGSAQSLVSLRISNGADPDVRKTFSLHTTSGHLRTVISLDREAKAVYVFPVLASDSLKGTIPARTATATVTVFVEDENDNSPVFVRPVAVTKTRSTFEDGRAHTGTESLSRVEDESIGKDDQLEGPSESDKNNHTTPLPGQNFGSHQAPVPFVVVHKHTWTQQVDNSGGQQIAHGRPLLQLEATDADSGENGKVTYHIGAGNLDGLFQLDNTTGTLMLAADARDPFHELMRSDAAQGTSQTQYAKGHLTYLLRFEACDRGVPKRCALPIWVRIMLDMNDVTHANGKDDVGIYSAPFGEYQPNLDVPVVGSSDLDKGSPIGAYMIHSDQQGEDRRFRSSMGLNSNQLAKQQTNVRSRGTNDALVARLGPLETPHEQVYSKWSASRSATLHDRRLSSLAHHPGTSSLVISEAVIVCLVVIFIVLLCTATLLIYLVRRKVILFGSSSRTKSKRSPGDPGASKRQTADKYVDQSMHEPMELAENSPVYQLGQGGLTVIPDGAKHSRATIPDPSNLSDPVERSMDQFVAQPLIRRNSDSRLGPCNGLNYNSGMTESIYVGGGPFRFTGRSDADYQSLLLKDSTPLGMANGTKAIGRSITPFCELGSKGHSMGNTGAYSAAILSPRWRSVSYQNPMSPIYRVHSPPALGVIHSGLYPTVRDNATLTSSLYGSNMLKQPTHRRENSTPVYPREAERTKWPAVSPTMDNMHTYHELSTLTATLRRHNYPSTFRPSGRMGRYPCSYNSFQPDQNSAISQLTPTQPFLHPVPRFNNETLRESLEDGPTGGGTSDKMALKEKGSYQDQSTGRSVFFNDMLNQSTHTQFPQNSASNDPTGNNEDELQHRTIISGFDMLHRTDATMKTSSSSLPLILDTGEEFATSSSPDHDPISSQEMSRLANRKAPGVGKYVYDAYREASFV